MVVSFTAVAVLGAFAAQALPDTQTASDYHYINAAAISTAPSTVGIADSDLYFASQETIDATLDKMASLGVKNVRVFIPWYDVNPDPDVFDWSKIDRVIAAADARGMGILAVVTHSPDWAVAPGDIPVTSPPADPADYGDFMALVAQRYKGKVSAYEIWNEPNASHAFYPKPDAARYTALLKDAYAKIKAIDPSVTVIAGVLAAIPTNVQGTEINSPSYLAEMYEAGAKGYFDAISFHPYQLSTPFAEGDWLLGSPLNEVREMRALMVSQGDAAKLIWASEYGLPTSVVSEQQQAAYIADFLNGWSAEGYLGPMFVYTTSDRDSASSDSEATFGIFRSDGTPKPAAQIIAEYIKAHPEVVVPPVTTPTPTPDFATLVTNLIIQLRTQYVAAVQQLQQQYVTVVQQLQQQFLLAVQQLQAHFTKQVASALAPAEPVEPTIASAVVAEDETSTDKTAVVSTADAAVSEERTTSVEPTAATPTTTPTTPTTPTTTVAPRPTTAESMTGESTSAESTTTSAPTTTPKVTETPESADADATRAPELVSVG